LNDRLKNMEALIEERLNRQYELLEALMRAQVSRNELLAIGFDA